MQAALHVACYMQRCMLHATLHVAYACNAACCMQRRLHLSAFAWCMWWRSGPLARRWGGVWRSKGTRRYSQCCAFGCCMCGALCRRAKRSRLVRFGRVNGTRSTPTSSRSRCRHGVPWADCRLDPGSAFGHIVPGLAKDSIAFGHIAPGFAVYDVAFSWGITDTMPWDTVPWGTMRWDTMPQGIPCRGGYHAVGYHAVGAPCRGAPCVGSSRQRRRGLGVALRQMMQRATCGRQRATSGRQRAPCRHAA